MYFFVFTNVYRRSFLKATRLPTTRSPAEIQRSWHFLFGSTCRVSTAIHTVHFTHLNVHTFLLSFPELCSWLILSMPASTDTGLWRPPAD